MLKFDFGSPFPEVFQILLACADVRTPLMYESAEAFDFLLQLLALPSHEYQRNLVPFLLVNEHLGTGRKDVGEDIPHPISQFDVTPRLPRLPLQRISLSVDFGENVVDA